jgi:hypothetical protein
MVEDMGDNCRCLELTPAVSIAAACRSAGGCPEHPAECQHSNPYLYGSSGNSEEWIRHYLCEACGAKWETVERRSVPVEPEPPLTPEEEEQAPDDEAQQLLKDPDFQESLAQFARGEKIPLDELPPPEGPEYTPCACGHIEPEHKADGSVCTKASCGCMLYRPEDAPPQPDNRPPYLVAYSVQGHLYEVAVSGDVTVRAVDGALVITHGLGPVAGIAQVMPVPSKEQG